MIVARFAVQCRPERSDEMAAVITAVEAPSLELPGVVPVDVTRSTTDPDTFVVLEVFEDAAALARQNAQAEVAAVLALVADGAVVREPEWTVREAAPTD
jgi:quinol monooxygenase YgiN